MQRSASSALLPLAAALERLLSAAHPVRPQRATLAAALGAFAVHDVVAPSDIPPRPLALRDGWAVPFAAVSGASPNSPVPLPERLPWVEAGAEMPGGTDAVLPPDAIEGREATAEAAAGEGVAGAGTELRAQDIIAGAGGRLGPRHLLALAYAGVREIDIRRPRIALLATGLERERDALAPALAALIAEFGCEPVRVEPPLDGLDGTATAIAMAAEGTDAVFVLGGTGFGRTDHSASALSQAGTLEAHGIGLRPGETAGFGQVAGKPVLLLPGRPDGALAAFITLGRPLLTRLAGCIASTGDELPLRRKISSGIGVSEVVFVRRGASGLEPLGAAGIPLRRLLQAEGVVLVPPEREGYPAGTEVEMMPLWTRT